jgi:molybdopterin molybdotransferase
VLLTTGDELVPPGEPLGAGQIHDSNRYSLGTLIEQCGAVVVRHERVRDDPARLRDALVRAAADADVVISSGGVSAGEADHMPDILREAGTVHFWKVRIKPGMPFLFGGVGEALVFSLPGNPVSGIATFIALVKPAFDAMTGRAPTAWLRARLASAVHKRHARVELLRARLQCDDAGVLFATPLKKQGSGMLAGVADADALVWIPEAAQDYPVGTVVDVVLLPGSFN